MRTYFNVYYILSYAYVRAVWLVINTERTYFICFTIVLLPHSPPPATHRQGNCWYQTVLPIGGASLHVSRWVYVALSNPYCPLTVDHFQLTLYLRRLCHRTHYRNTWSHPQNRKYITYYKPPDREWSSHGHRQHEIFFWSLGVCFLGYAGWQAHSLTEKQTDIHAQHNTSLNLKLISTLRNDSIPETPSGKVGWTPCPPQSGHPMATPL